GAGAPSLVRPRFVARELAALDLGREVDRVPADLLRGTARALGEEVAQAGARSDLDERTVQRPALAEAEPRRIDQAALGALHRPGDRPSRRDRVDAELVAQLTRLEHRVGVRDTAERAEGEDIL